MRLSARMEEALNRQINREIYSANLYFQMASYFARRELNGFRHFFIVQHDEEIGHAKLQLDYLNNRGGELKLGAIEAPPSSFESPVNALEIALEHEKAVSQAIYHLVDLAHEEKDFATISFLDWFLREQVEEEALIGNLLERLKLVIDTPSALFILDTELGKRTNK